MCAYIHIQVYTYICIYIHIYIYICIYTHVSIYKHRHMHICIYISIHTCVYIHIHIHIHIHVPTYIYIYIYVYICMYVCLCVCVCVFIYIYTCTHILAQEMQRLKTRRQGKLRLHTGLHNAHLNSNIRDCFFAPLLFLVVIGSFAFYFEVRLPFWLKSFPRPPEPRLPPCQQGLGQFRGEEMGATFYPACVSPKSYHRCTRLPQNASHDLHALL